MILWPRQLDYIQRLQKGGQIESIQLIALPLRVQITVNYLDGKYKTIELDHDGKSNEGD